MGVQVWNEGVVKREVRTYPVRYDDDDDDDDDEGGYAGDAGVNDSDLVRV